MEEFVNRIQEEINVIDKDYMRKIQVCVGCMAKTLSDEDGVWWFLINTSRI